MNNDEMRTAYRQLRIQNVPAADAIKDVAERVGLDPVQVKAIIFKKQFLPTSQDGFVPFATSTLYRGPKGEDSEVVLQWVKEARDNSREAAEAMIKAMAESLPRFKTQPVDKKNYRSDVIAVYPMGDPHFGLHAWGEEAGEDFDLKIAERDLCAAVDRLVQTVPDCEEALIINLGDFFHADNNESCTARAGHSLDTDTRWVKVLRTGVKALRQCIESALKKHKHVTVINAIGNHDDHSSLFLSVALANVYEDEKRVTINDAPTIKHYHRFGANLFGVHHGHTIKMQDLPLQMAIDRPDDWSQAKYRFYFTGHIHHDSKKEIGGVIIESFRTLAAKDAWHASMGYQSGRDMCSILFHRDFGEVERHKVSITMLEAIRKGQL